MLEFGVRRGASLAVLAAHAGQEVHGFDSFEGLPEGWGATHAGVLTTGGALPEVGNNARLHPGWFEDTLPAFLETHSGPVRFANIDSDIYSSARTVLFGLAGRIGPGTVLVFDEFIGNRTWMDDEYRAFAEFAAAHGTSFQVIAVNPACKQVAVRIEA
ncbi:class I SAM-dependent methyltransferase [Paramagnetospirillum magneticum]|uniref:class I SAM-dependent methyltransferase n=1 Tax=Paramagnetospirillum magneticum TaxID=84159 RepID=UPI00031A2FAF|nr:class I SAM-dependent methyltransferase [Paramagnetospirillum magneticum]